MLDFGYYLIGGQTLIYILATLYLIRRLRIKGRENQQLSGEVSALKFKLWDEKRKLKNAQDHITLLENDNAVFLRREIDRIKNRNKPTAEVMQLKADNNSLTERLMKSESERRHLEEKVLALTGKYPTYCDASVSVIVECKRLEKELALSRVQIKDLEECNSRLYAKSAEKSDECAACQCESQMLKKQMEAAVSANKHLDDKIREQRSEIESQRASLAVKPTFSDLHAISVQNDSLRSQVAVLRAENFALQSKRSLSLSERECEQLRTANKDLTERLQSVYDSNRNKYEEYKALSDEVCILKKRVVDLMKENVELKEQADSLEKSKTYLANLIEALNKDNRRLRESWSNKGNSSNYRGTTF